MGKVAQVEKIRPTGLKVGLARWWSRVLRPPRTIRPTREGWGVLFAAVGLGFAAMNTGNNLLYLLVSMLLGLIVVSGMLSERSMRGLRIAPRMPDEVFAGLPVLFGAMIVNEKRRAASYSITLEILGRAGLPRLVHVPRLKPGGEHLFMWEETFSKRGRQRLAGFRVTTRFPFGLFRKAGRVVLGAEVIVYPSIGRLPPESLRETGMGAAARRRGRGHDLYNLREYRWGDSPRLIHWRSSAKAGSLMVRELEAESSADVRIRLEGTGASDGARLEAALSEAASLAMRLIRSGSAVELVGPGVHVALGRGRPHERKVLTALALYEPPAPGWGTAAQPLPGRSPVPVREIRVDLDGGRAA